MFRFPFSPQELQDRVHVLHPPAKAFKAICSPNLVSSAFLPVLRNAEVVEEIASDGGNRLKSVRHELQLRDDESYSYRYSMIEVDGLAKTSETTSYKLKITAFNGEARFDSSLVEWRNLQLLSRISSNLSSESSLVGNGAGASRSSSPDSKSKGEGDLDGVWAAMGRGSTPPPSRRGGPPLWADGNTAGADESRRSWLGVASKSVISAAAGRNVSRRQRRTKMLSYGVVKEHRTSTKHGGDVVRKRHKAILSRGSRESI
ncbi:hypothetical protein NL676_019009 [Syzygium grande]|nr:hypothetical protein NL676_019009 [Syzygium grande]